MNDTSGVYSNRIVFLREGVGEGEWEGRAVGQWFTYTDKKSKEQTGK